MKGSTPKYIVLYQQIKGEILSGKFPVGTFLPTENELVSLYSASRTTIRHAIAMLKEEKLLDVKQGRGTEVLPVSSLPSDFKKFRNTSEIAAHILVEGEYTVNTVGSVIDLVHPHAKAAEALGISTNDNVYRLQKLQAVNGVPFAFMSHYLRCDSLPNFQHYSGKISHLASFIKKEYGILISFSKETISATLADFVESRMLNIEAGSPLLAFSRISYTEAGPLEYGETFTRPDMFEIVVSMDGVLTLSGEK